MEILANKNISKLDLSNTGIDKIPPEVFQLKNLKKLNLSGNNISIIPKEIENLSKLETLDISKNKIKVFYSKLCTLKRLKILNLNHNQIKTIPKQICNLKKLISFHIGYNVIDILPLELFEIVTLRELDVGNNKISILPEEILQLTFLRKIWLNNLHISKFPMDSILEMKNLSNIYCFGDIKSKGTLDASFDILQKIKGNSIKELSRVRVIENIIKQNDKNMDEVKSIFISYSHEDKEWFKRLKVHLKVIKHLKFELNVWDDTRLKTGDKWKDEIEKAIKEASIVVMLISADFLASDFINEKEIPDILKKVELEGVRILPIIVEPCLFELSVLSEFQSVNSPTKPLSKLPKSEAEEYLVKLSGEIIELVR